MMKEVLASSMLTLGLAGCSFSGQQADLWPHGDLPPANIACTAALAGEDGDPNPICVDRSSKSLQPRPVADERSRRWLPCSPGQRRFIVPGMAPRPTLLSAARAGDGRPRVEVIQRRVNRAVAIVTGVPGRSPARYRLYRMDVGWFVDQIAFCRPNR